MVPETTQEDTMAKKNQKMVEEITAMDADFAQWYTAKRQSLSLIPVSRAVWSFVPTAMPSGKIYSGSWTQNSRRPDM